MSFYIFAYIRFNKVVLDNLFQSVIMNHQVVIYANKASIFSQSEIIFVGYLLNVDITETE